MTLEVKTLGSHIAHNSLRTFLIRFVVYYGNFSARRTQTPRWKGGALKFLSLTNVKKSRTINLLHNSTNYTCQFENCKTFPLVNMLFVPYFSIQENTIHFTFMKNNFHYYYYLKNNTRKTNCNK